jgi:DNA-binding NarL/FixJ family response regulator
LLELARYIVVTTLDEWQWSSYALTVQHQPAPPWLQVEWLLSQFGATRFLAQHYAEPSKDRLSEVTRVHRRALALSLADYQSKFPGRDQAILQAYLSTAYTMKQIGTYFNVSHRTVSRIVGRLEGLPSSPCAFGRIDPE